MTCMVLVYYRKHTNWIISFSLADPSFFESDFLLGHRSTFSHLKLVIQVHNFKNTVKIKSLFIFHDFDNRQMGSNSGNASHFHNSSKEQQKHREICIILFVSISRKLRTMLHSSGSLQKMTWESNNLRPSS